MDKVVLQRSALEAVPDHKDVVFDRYRAFYGTYDTGTARTISYTGVFVVGQANRLLRKKTKGSDEAVEVDSVVTNHHHLQQLFGGGDNLLVDRGYFVGGTGAGARAPVVAPVVASLVAPAENAPPENNDPPRRPRGRPCGSGRAGRGPGGNGAGVQGGGLTKRYHLRNRLGGV